MIAEVRPPPRTKPVLRGWSHQIASVGALFAGGLLVATAAPGRPTVAAAVYTACLVTLLAVSALYHRPTWQPVARQRMRRVDHSAIFLLIAGTYTPICMLALPPDAGRWLLVLVWAGALAGVVKSLFWVHAPKPLSAALFLALGWAGVWQWQAVGEALGSRGVAFLAAGGALYTAGAIIYALKRPDPLPIVFGYHEIFHLLVIAAAACHFEVVRLVVLAAV